MTRTSSLALFTLAGALAVAMTPGEARACGGFFCNNSQPVNQSAERIIFARGADGTVTAVIQIQYAGPSEQFAWMLPVPGTPEIAVSSNTAFTRLQSATNPQYTLTTTVEGTCRDDGGRGFPSAGAQDAAAARNDGGMGPPVTVVDSGAVGPYDYVIINVDPSAMDLAAEAVAWLRSNDYDVPELGADRLTPYLEAGMNLLAFRLTKGNDAGSIRPVMLGFGSGLPSIPIRPTAVAATDDMGVMVWVLGQHRAVPVNYMSLELNEALIDWTNPGRTYNDVVTRAANEAGGQGFVTEMAGPAAPLADAVLFPFERDDWASVRGADWTGRHGELLTRVLNSYGTFDGARDAIGRTLPLPDGVTLEELLSCVFCYYDGTEAEIPGLDPAAFLAAFEADVMQPMEATRALFEASPYMTRLYTTMSADEMTRDPMFDQNPDLGDYSNVHNADRVIECSPSVSRGDAPWRVSLPDGTLIRGSGRGWPFSADGALPANRTIRRVGEAGPGEIVEDNVAAIQLALDEHNATIPRPTPESSDGGCAVRPAREGAGGGLGLALASLALVAIRRRRA